MTLWLDTDELLIRCNCPAAYQQAVDWMLALQVTLKQTHPVHGSAMMDELVQYLRQEKRPSAT